MSGVIITNGERKFMSGTEQDWAQAQKIMDAKNLIAAGKATGDELTINVGQARLRQALGRTPLPGDFDVLHIE